MCERKRPHTDFGTTQSNEVYKQNKTKKTKKFLWQVLSSALAEALESGRRILPCKKQESFPEDMNCDLRL